MKPTRHAAFTHPKRPQRRWITLSLSTALALSACVSTPRRMAAPGDLGQNAEQLDTSGRQQGTGLFVAEDFQLGAYRISHVKRGFSSQDGFSLGVFSNKSQKEGFSYRFAGPRDWDGSCDYKSQEKGLKIGVLLESNRATLSCHCRHGEQEARLELKDEWKPLEGRMYLAGSEYRMSQIAERRTQNGMELEQNLKSPALGYRVDSLRGASVAAVEVLHPGRVWRHRQLPAEQGEPMACLLAGLMLYGPQDGR